MSKSTTFETDLLSLIFLNTAIAGIAAAPTSPFSNLYLSLHTASLNDNPSQSTSEVSYGGYARVAIPRTSAGFTVSGWQVTLTSARDFPQCTSGSVTASHFALGTASSGTGKVLYSGPLNTPLTITTGVVPRMSQLTITED